MCFARSILQDVHVAVIVVQEKSCTSFVSKLNTAKYIVNRTRTAEKEWNDHFYSFHVELSQMVSCPHQSIL